LGHPCKFQRLSRLGSVTARHSSSGRQPNFAALNRGHTYIRQGDHHVGHWPTFIVCLFICRKLKELTCFAWNSVTTTKGVRSDHIFARFVLRALYILSPAVSDRPSKSGSRSTRNTGTVHICARARFTSVAIRDLDRHQNSKFNHLFIGPLPTFPENFMQIRLEVFAQSCY